MNHSSGAMNHSMRAMNHSLGAMNHSLGAMNHSLCAMNHSLCAMNHSLCAMNRSWSMSNHSSPRLARFLGIRHTRRGSIHVMPDPTQTPASPKPPRFPLADVLPAIGSERRWCILRELAKGESLPVCEIAARLGATPAGISKHFAVLNASGIVRRTYGGNYDIDPRFRVPGQLAIDIGHALLRFD